MLSTKLLNRNIGINIIRTNNIKSYNMKPYNVKPYVTDTNSLKVKHITDLNTKSYNRFDEKLFSTSTLSLIDSNLTVQAERDITLIKMNDFKKCFIPFYKYSTIEIDNFMMLKFDKVINDIKKDIDEKKKVGEKSQLEFYLPNVEYLKHISQSRIEKIYYRHYSNVSSCLWFKTFFGGVALLGSLYLLPQVWMISFPAYLFYGVFQISRALDEPEAHYNQRLEKFLDIHDMLYKKID